MDAYFTAAAALAFVVWSPLWSWSRHLVTLVHEGGHAFVALLTGRRLNSITLHSDTSGLTTSSGKPTGIGMMFTAAAGYTAPAVVGLIIAALIQIDQPGWAMSAALILLALMLLHIRNWFGLLVVVLAGSITTVIVVWSSDTAQDIAATSLAWFMLFAAPRPVGEMWNQRRRRRTRTSDADLLARITHIPAVLWATFFLLFNLAALGLGAWWLALERLLR